MLSFQRLDVYRCAIELLAFTATVQFPRGLAHLADQLRRAALSVPLNIAEAAGRGSPAMDSRRVLAILDETRHAEAIEVIARIVAMLTKLCR